MTTRTYSSSSVELDRPETHRPPAGKAGPDTEIDPTWRQFVERSECIRRYRGDPVRGDQHAGAQPDPRRLYRRCGHCDERVCAQHLCVVEPGAGKPQLFGSPDDSPGIGIGGNGNRKSHYRLRIRFLRRNRRKRRGL